MYGKCEKLSFLKPEEVVLGVRHVTKTMLLLNMFNYLYIILFIQTLAMGCCLHDGIYRIKKKHVNK